MTVLGISLGTSRTGVCVLKGDVLLDRHIHRFDDEISEGKIKAIMSRYRRYVTKHRVDAIMLKIPPLSKHSTAISEMMDRIEALAKEYDCLFDLITKNELKHVTATKSTKELVEFTRRLYPELSSLHEKGSSGSFLYYRKVFEAVLSAHIFKERQLSRARRMGIPI